MKNFKIYNEADSAKVEIIGAIGESWFEEGHTLETVKDQIKGLDVSNVVVEVSSLGGDLIQGLAIHDLFKNINAKVTAKIIGATASAGTIVALGADSVEITENSRFLIHNASTITAGNAEDHQAQADQLASFDAQIVDIYRKKTGKPKSAIKALMKDEKFLTSADAKEFGFIDKIIKPKVVNQIHIKMEQVLKVFNVKTEAEVLAKIQESANEITNLKAELATEKEFSGVLKEEITAFENAKIETLISNAIEAGKFKDEQKEAYTALATADFENAKSVIDAIKVDVKPGFINKLKEDATEPVVKNYKWYMENDAKALIEMQENEPEKFEAIYNAKSE